MPKLLSIPLKIHPGLLLHLSPKQASFPLIMAPTTSISFFFFFSILTLLPPCSSGRYAGPPSKWEAGRKFTGFYRETLNSPATVFPTPTIITVPATNPVTVTPASPAATPLSVPLTTPVTVPATNPANSPVPFTEPVSPTVTIPGAQPITNPVTTYPAPSGGVPLAPPAMTNAPASPGQSWCVAKSGAAQMALQSALDYACGTGIADCSQIQQGGSCYNPNTLENHASFAFNSYFQKNPAPTSCDFGGSATITTSNPSSGSCIYPSSPSSSSSASTPASLTPSVPTPASTTPIQTPPTTTTDPIPMTSSPTGTGMPENGTPPVLNTSNPASSVGGTTGFGSEIPPSSATSESMAAGLRPLAAWWITVMISVITGQMIQNLKW